MEAGLNPKHVHGEESILGISVEMLKKKKEEKKKGGGVRI